MVGGSHKIRTLIPTQASMQSSDVPCACVDVSNRSHDRPALIRYEQRGRWMICFTRASAGFRKLTYLIVSENHVQTRAVIDCG